MILQRQSMIVYLVWATLIIAAIAAMAVQRWSMGFVALATLGASMLPALAAARYELRVPVAFLSFVTLFIFASLFLGEAFDFYNLYWWWDIALHASSAIGFGLIGFVFIFYLFEGDRYAAPHWAVAFLSWGFAVAIGAVWEVFEFTMDSLFGTNMLKSGLRDTMGDLIVNIGGAAIGAVSGYLYLKGQDRGGLLAWVIADFVRLNRGLFKRRDRGP